MAIELCSFVQKISHCYGTFLRSSVSLALSYALCLWPWSPSEGCRFHSDGLCDQMSVVLGCFVVGLAEPGGPFLASDPKRGIFSTESGCFMLYIAETAVIQPSSI